MSTVINIQATVDDGEVANISMAVNDEAAATTRSLSFQLTCNSIVGVVIVYFGDNEKANRFKPVSDVIP